MNNGGHDEARLTHVAQACVQLAVALAPTLVHLVQTREPAGSPIDEEAAIRAVLHILRGRITVEMRGQMPQIPPGAVPGMVVGAYWAQWQRYCNEELPWGTPSAVTPKRCAYARQVIQETITDVAEHLGSI